MPCNRAVIHYEVESRELAMREKVIGSDHCPANDWLRILFPDRFPSFLDFRRL